MRISIVAIYVNDQEKAKEFYTSKLGFTVKQDTDYGNETRWLTVVSSRQSDVEIQLSKPEFNEQQHAQEAMYRAGRPFLSFTTEDIEAEYQRLKKKGVEFTSKPQKRPYGGVDAVFDDMCGNLINLHQN